MKVDKEPIYKLSSLGCNFALQKENGVYDPEKTILSSLAFFWKDKKMFTMLTAVLVYRVSGLINTNRLFLESQTYNKETQVILKALALKVFRKTGDKRYNDLAQKIKHKKIKLKLPKEYQDSFYIERRGLDPDFKKVGIKVADFFETQSEKKLKPLKRIYKENLWLRLRAIAGPDYRADTIYLKKIGKGKTQAEITKILGCNKSSISRIWASIKEIDSLVDYIP